MSTVEKAKNLLLIESKAIARSAQLIDAQFANAVDVIESAIKNHKKLIFCGIGKSHYVAAKLAASFNSAGMTSLFIHPVEAFHGDLGAIAPGDVCLLFSKSGATAEILALLPFLKSRNPIIAITGGKDSPLSQASTCVLDASVEEEACPINLLPTASTTVAMAIGDALLSVCSEKQGLTKEVFAGFHPGGSLGRRLSIRVDQVMLAADKVACGDVNVNLKTVALAMGDKPQGAFCVVENPTNTEKKLLGFVTEGDIRRAVAKGLAPDTKIKDLMSVNPTCLKPDLLINEAIATLERPEKKITTAPVVDASGVWVGLIRLHDLI